MAIKLEVAVTRGRLNDTQTAQRVASLLERAARKRVLETGAKSAVLLDDGSLRIYREGYPWMVEEESFISARRMKDLSKLGGFKGFRVMTNAGIYLVK